MMYRGFQVDCRSFDWRAVHRRDYDGPGCDIPVLTADSLEELVEAIDDLLQEEVGR